MKIYHTSPTEITEIEKYGQFDDMLFFSHIPYEMIACKTILYSLEIEDDEVLNVRQLFYVHDSEEVRSYIEHVMNVLGVNEDNAMDLLDDSISSYDIEMEYDQGEAGWLIQTQQGHIARELGYKAASGRDEQGDVFIVPMFGRVRDLVIE